MLLQPDNLDLILAMIKEVEAHVSKRHWTLMKKSEVKNKHKIKMGRSIIFDTFGVSSAGYYQIEY